MRKWLVAVVILACAACGGSGSAKVTQSVTGGTNAERSLAREVLQKLEPSPVTVVRFLGPTHMNVTARRAYIGSSFEEYVFAYSYALIARERHLPIRSVSLDLGYGSVDDALAGKPSTPIDNAHLHAFEDRLRTAAKSTYATIWFRELQPEPVALEATLRTSHAAAFLKYDAASFVRSPPKGLFGFLFRVAYPSGKIAFSDGYGGITWDPPLFGCIQSLITFSPPSNNIPVPPCPA